ncbi:hypothetical protein ACFSGX_05620 [Sphingomonas arantia]|uniref:Heavy metal-binding domain-containing protein n=1 Tax=Sphingomonas arantia TaxID=1460676 RepID=A0ABW4TYA1_9SPHN
MYRAEYKGIAFIEGCPPGVVPMRQLDTKIDGWFSQSQLKSLDNIKDVMVDQARADGANAIVNFKYGQKNSFWRSLLSVDDVYWFATGATAKIV